MNRKILYVSDLDGTLLNSNAGISDYAVNSLNALLDKGLYFTVATARSHYSAMKILEDIHLSLPLILMNGVLFFDPVRRMIMRYESLDDLNVSDILEVCRQYGVCGFLYGISGGKMTAYYKRSDNQYSDDFIQERMNLYNKSFLQVESFHELAGQTDVVYFTTVNTYEYLAPAYQSLRHIPGISCVFYADNYMKNGWYLEIFSQKATKKNAALKLKQQLGFGRLIGFGDNLNDLSLFEACDECYAVANAKDAVKRAATAVIDSNENDGVARWLENNHK